MLCMIVFALSHFPPFFSVFRQSYFRKSPVGLDGYTLTRRLCGLLLVDHLQRRWRRTNELLRRSAHGHAGSSAAAAAITGSAATSAADRLPPGASVRRRRRRQRHDDGHLRPAVVIVDVVVFAVVVGRIFAQAAAAAAGRRRDAYQSHCQLPATDHVTRRHSRALLEPRRHRVVQTHPRQIHRYRRCSFVPHLSLCHRSFSFLSHISLKVFVYQTVVGTNKWASTLYRRNAGKPYYAFATKVHLVSLWPWPLTSDLENLFSDAPSRAEYLCQV